MRNALVVAALLAATFSAQASITKIPPLPTTPAEQVDSTRAAVLLAYQYVDDNDLPTAAATFDSAIHSNGFANLPEDMRYRALLLAGQIAEQSGKHQLAYGLLVRASESSQADAPAWHSRLAAAYSLQDYRGSARCVQTIARRWPDTLGEINDRAIYSINTHLGEGNAQAREQRDLLESLFDAKWADQDGEPSALWRDLTRLLLSQGNAGKATSVAARVRSARVALSMRVDKRFDRIGQGNGQSPDIDRIAAEELAAARDQVKATPDQLRPLTLVQGLLLDSLQFDQALAIGDEVIAKTKGSDGSSIYKDFDDQYIWILDQRSRALARLGRWDEAVDQWLRAARRPEHGVMNVSQILNLGLLYADLGRSREALDIVSELGPMSPYGRMQIEMVKLQAAIQQADKPAIATHMAFLREHRIDAIDTWEKALLLRDETVGAAADLLVERLNSEQWRSSALEAMQQYADVPTTSGNAERLQRWHRVVAEPKVMKALAKVGRVERFNLEPPET